MEQNYTVSVKSGTAGFLGAQEELFQVQDSKVSLMKVLFYTQICKTSIMLPKMCLIEGTTSASLTAPLRLLVDWGSFELGRRKRPADF